MRFNKLHTCLLAGTWLLAPAWAQDAKPFLSPVFGSHMVLQRGIKDPVWGWAAPGSKVTVAVAGKTATTTAGSDGTWLAKVGPLEAGGPYTLLITGPQSVALDDVLVGDVWVGSGQSNMQMSVASSKDAAKEIAAATHGNIRLYTVPNVTALSPQQTEGGAWALCTPDTVGPFSAAAYFFGRDINEAIDVPIGLIETCWGGTPIEAWTSEEGLATVPQLAAPLKQVDEIRASLAGGTENYAQREAAWYAASDPGTNAHWENPALDTSDWKTMTLPTAWEDAGLPNLDGVVWFRKEFTLSADASANPAELHFGQVDDRDTTFVNGVWVGATGQVDRNRSYTVPASVLKTGTNVIAVRVLDTGGAGGFTGNADQMSLAPKGGDSISLAGPWLYKVGADLAKTSPVPVRFDNNPSLPSVLYNAMIAPVLPYGIKGAIWYQGEANAGQAYLYRTLLPTMIKDWRSRWGVGDFPFYIVSLANYMPRTDAPVDSEWAELREAQAMTAASVKHTGLAMAIDIGETNDIHPKNKQEVGRRLALNALAKDYGQKVEYSGPEFKALKVADGKISLSFTHVAGGLVAKGDKLTGFAIAGEDRKFVWADAAIDGDKVVVSSPAVPNPVAVRYAWANNPVCDLYNRAGLPAGPFRTDTWPGITQGK